MKSTKERIESKIKIVNGCWIWQGGVHERGYGLMWYKGKVQLAHRISYLTYKGQIAKDLNVCHTCDNPKCVNPKHLWLGTQADNLADMINKGRDKKAKGEQAGRAKLRNCDVIAIRKSKKSTLELAERYGVSRSQIYYILNNTNWKHLIVGG